METRTYDWFSERVHDYIRDYIRLADEKAAFVFGAAVAAGAVVYRLGPSLNWVGDLSSWTGSGLGEVLGLVFLALAAGSAIVVVIPRLRGSRAGLIFWQAIAERENASEYAAEVKLRSAEELEEELIRHCYDLAVICKRKYRWLSVSFWSAIVGLLISISYVVLATPSSGRAVP